ncbi:phosphatidate cytidylyltransferase [Magnetovibrio sp. PR-2]|uniref:phosphatidate cytidylyltransferase n=1 Tax=Magnetovibrio sp. PR-2 TaxID=3120356 RepID=UPI002FCE5284
MLSPSIKRANAGTVLSVSSSMNQALKLRLLSAFVLAPLVLAGVYVGGWIYVALIALMGLILMSEWANMVEKRAPWMVLGVFYVALSVWALWALRQDPQFGRLTIFWLLAVVWGADTGGYAFGKNIGGPKLAPRISPNKTWSGFLGGTLLAALAGWGVVSYFRPEVALNDAGLSVVLLGAALAVVSQIGDLLESSVKRRFDVKDSGTIIPGHGGVFDRVDGLVAAAIALAFVNLSLQETVLAWLL